MLSFEIMASFWCEKRIKSPLAVLFEEIRYFRVSKLFFFHRVTLFSQISLQSSSCLFKRNFALEFF